MRILVDIGHPAHVHYFKNFIKVMENKGHLILIVARDKDVSLELLNNYGLKFYNRGKGSNNPIGKILYMFYADWFIFKIALKQKIDLFVSFASPYCAQVAKIFGKPHIAFDDTEHAKFSHFFYRPFTTFILTPEAYLKKIKNKQIKFPSFMELSYLHPDVFSPDKKVLEKLQIESGEKFVIIRFVSWKANHDVGHFGFSSAEKIKLVNLLSQHAKVFISSETALPVELEKFRLRLPSNKLHDILYYCSVYVGEGATTASECVMLGVPAIYVNTLSAGTLKKQQDYGLLIETTDFNIILDKAIEFIKDDNIRNTLKMKHEKLLSENISLTPFMVWFIDNFPDSIKKIKNNPEYQFNFKS